MKSPRLLDGCKNEQRCPKTCSSSQYDESRHIDLWLKIDISMPAELSSDLTQRLNVWAKTALCGGRKEIKRNRNRPV